MMASYQKGTAQGRTEADRALAAQATQAGDAPEPEPAAETALRTESPFARDTTVPIGVWPGEAAALAELAAGRQQRPASDEPVVEAAASTQSDNGDIPASGAQPAPGPPPPTVNSQHPGDR
jgi:hypothetical protein